MNIKDAVAADLRGHEYIKARELTPKALYQKEPEKTPYRPDNMSFSEFFRLHGTLPSKDIEYLIDHFRGVLK